MKNYIVNIPEYNPENVVYGFVTKFLPGCTHHYDWRNGVYPEAASNRRAVLEMLGFGSRQLAMVNQVHGTNCVIIEEAPLLGTEIDADGHVTTNKNIVLAIKTADCVPVLFHDPKNGVIGACHAGWRGALAGITTSTVKKMLESGAQIANIETIVGPCIQQASYEVDSNFYQNFLAEDVKNESFFIKSSRVDHYMFDLPGYVIRKLQADGIKLIFNSAIDTLKEENKFFSYRRNTLRNVKLDGYMLSVIGLK